MSVREALVALRPFRLGVLLATVLTGFPQAALAQERDEPRSVQERPRGAFDAKGLDLGGFRLFPRLSVSETYDDNVFADEDGEQDDLITSVTAALLARSEWSRHELQVSGNLRHQAFLDNSDQDRTEYFIRPRLRLDLAERNTLGLRAEHSRRVVGRDDPEDSDEDDPTEFNRFLSELKYTHRFNRLSVGGAAFVRRDDFVSTGDDDRDRTEYRFGLPIGYELSAITDLKFEPFYRIRDFDEVDETGADRDAQAAGATLGFDTELTRLFHVGLEVGFIANDFEDSRFDDEVDFIAEGNATWYVTAMTTVKGRLARRDTATNQPGSSSKTQTTVAGEVQHELQRNILLLGVARYIQDDFREIDRTDDRAIFGLGGEYLLNRYLSLAADYRFEQRWSDVDEQDFTRNLVTLGLRTKF
ncbi:outer membrane beta-barrel protein [Pelagibius sp.]|uniref:outer membrane beta-barrel protein n=1 Tax=Pelagibius sp. TaxID=1931238 RepID=UPI00261C176D|nr:outer membrane beta-barrel protein [Pelagibius sp.]